MLNWWRKFLKKSPMIVNHPKYPKMRYDVDHWHLITIFGYEFAILKLHVGEKQ
jgi:hypothetical protein